MNMYVGENIKRLRKEKNITQEKLAEHLSISCQAISKWERGETFPDITLVIPIASYFDVSTDELLGVDYAKNEVKIQEYLREYRELSMQGKGNECSAILVKAHKEFPNDFRIMSWYTQDITGGRGSDKSVDEKVLAHAEEAEALCERILSECTVDSIRSEAVVTLSRVKKARGDVDKALESLAILPNWFSTQGQVTEQLFPKDTEEWRYWLSKNFYELCDFAHNKLLKMIWFFDGEFDEKVNMTLRLADYLLEILEETGYELLYRAIWQTYAEIGRQHRFAEKHEEIAKYYDMGFEYAVKFDEFLASDRESRYVTNEMKKGIWRWSADRGNSINMSIAWLENNPWFAETRKLDNFNAMLEKYRPYANSNRE